MRAMILAAGRGERMRPLSDRTPKPLLQVGGRALIEYHIRALAQIGVSDIVVNLSWKGEMIREVLGEGARFGLRLHYTHEGDVALETGGGIVNALPLLGEGPFLVVSGDIWTDYPFARAFAAIAAEDTAHLVFVPNPAFHARGDFGLVEGRVVDRPGPRYTYGNIGVFRREFFAGCQVERFPLVHPMRRWIDAGRVGGELYDGRWRNVGTPEQLAALDRELTNRDQAG